ncbi:DUF5908 family protein [Hymenobacter negativus]|uniref:Uncharacterized protein n=1 Tax=Hymenobacter negativus TaxID=2795026 RepID=A0ABS3QJY1_9BACT|nr:DUF5908 family protein [Hymenobacter negativus]MBO2011563.1 hypothetical protein [Hymenobacter negativus]
MPIEIKELHIRITVNAPEGGATGAGTTAGAATPAPAGGGVGDKEAIVADCVEQVLSILHEKLER